MKRGSGGFVEDQRGLKRGPSFCQWCGGKIDILSMQDNSIYLVLKLNFYLLVVLARVD